MKRYFIVGTEDLPVSETGPEWILDWHSLDLGMRETEATGFHVVVLQDVPRDPPPAWHELPSVLDAVATLSDPEHARALRLLGAVGASSAHTGYALARLLGALNPFFRP